MTTPMILTNGGNGLWHYAVREGWQWANIYIRPFIHGEQAHRGVEVVINSDYGRFAYCWGHIGHDDWRAFLSGLNCDYAMGKLAGSSFYSDIDVEGLFTQMKRRLVEDARQWPDATVIAKYRANITEMRWRIEMGDCRDLCELESEWRDVTGRDDQLIDFRLQETSPQVKGFWSELWQPFAAHLRAEMTAQAA